MRSIIRYIVRKSRGGIAVREEIVESEILVAGRGNDCGLHLPDPRVLFHHAEFVLRSGSLYVSALPGGDLRINGNLSEGGRIATGAKVCIGPYEITAEEPPAGLGIALGVELVQALGDDLEELVERSRIHITRIGLSLRGWSWLLAGLVLLATLGAPLALDRLMPPPPGGQALDPLTRPSAAAPMKIWTAGPVSSPHKVFGGNCVTCHEHAFIPVKDSACLSCHAGIQNHADPRPFPFARFADATCEDCHKEHRGTPTIALDDESFCAGCHGDLEGRAHGTRLHNVSDFTHDHPEFRPTILVNSLTRTADRSRPAGDTVAQDMGLKFPHDRHLSAAGVRGGSGAMAHLACADCHVPDAGGVAMQAVTFERNCHGCHQLDFDANVPGRELVHGKPEQMFSQVHDVYEALAVQGGYAEPSAPAVIRRRPGTPLTTEDKQVVGDWATAKTDAVINGRFGKGLCGECHVLVGASAAMPGTEASWTVAPVILDAVYFPKAKFSHAPHQSTDCGSCHAARTSTTSADVLMPGVKVCQSCHGSPQATDRVPSACTKCHTFHNKNMAPMHSAPVTREYAPTGETRTAAWTP